MEMTLQIAKTYGRLYDWEAALTACPAGWHLPSDEEWATLIKYLDPEADSNAVGPESDYCRWYDESNAERLEDGTGLWLNPNADATNSSGFSAVPGGARWTKMARSLLWICTPSTGPLLSTTPPPFGSGSLITALKKFTGTIQT